MIYPSELSKLGKLQPLLGPTRPQAFPKSSDTQRAIRHVIHLPVHLDTRPLFRLRPDRQPDRVITLVIENTRRNREHHLIADVRIVPTILVPIDEQLCAVSLGRIRWGREHEGDGDVQTSRDIEGDDGAEEADGCAGEAQCRGGCSRVLGRPGAVVEAGEVPAHAFCEEAVLVEDAADGIEVRFPACGAGEAPAGEFRRGGRGVVGEEAGREDAAWV
ncbi:hypothetical protein CNMCM6936_007150 [Aspergillus lentulus]|uniref:Uncharacterized protein n=1 Tax=Aspergillus lentulus TaxID=293939 RepID=A0AAN6BLR9_ASPLE|nr:hypothetical protein CNMCM6069_000335 [Aspergillus lentulus]KAF4165953.1 hypothetical protein CNMCM6936_007150 [Aspergillus lentulus]KAF4202228.1 hypothetical protein CNMCM8927_000548 [Aspergillus lentulus]